LRLVGILFGACEEFFVREFVTFVLKVAVGQFLKDVDQVRLANLPDLMDFLWVTGAEARA
jgi:hypothetical protein